MTTDAEIKRNLHFYERGVQAGYTDVGEEITETGEYTEPTPEQLDAVRLGYAIGYEYGESILEELADDAADVDPPA